MTQKETLREIRALGLAASYNADWLEYRITPKGMTRERTEALAHYTPDADDAIGTAHALRRYLDKGGK